MKNVMQSLACVLFIGGLAACASPRVLGASKRIVPATIFLTGANPASCSAKVAPGLIQVKKNEDVDWTIIDSCGGTKGYAVDVELRWSSANPTCGDGAKSPLEPSQGEPKGKKNIKRGINPKCAANLKFSYEVWLEGKLLVDPELEIVQ